MFKGGIVMKKGLIAALAVALVLALGSLGEPQKPAEKKEEPAEDE